MVAVVEGRRYRVVSERLGVDETGTATRMGDHPGFFIAGIAGWGVTPDGFVGGVREQNLYRVEAVNEPEASAPHPPETTAERHAADLNDLGGNRPRLDERRLELRRLHALERIADALEAMVTWPGVPDEEQM